MKPSSANVLLRALKAGMNTAVRLELIERNPFAKCSLLKVAPIEPSYLTPEEFSRLLAAIDDQAFRVFVIVAVLTGMRRGELVHLRWSEVDMKRRLIKVTNTEEFTVKGMRPRVIPMNQDLHRILNELMVGSAYVLTDRQGKPFSSTAVTKRFKQAVRRAGLSETIHLHSVRHTHASWLLQASTPLSEIQRLLGHSSIATTEIYSHMEQEHLRGAVERLRLPASQAISPD